MPAAVTFVRATLNDSDTLNAATFNALTAPSATVPDVVPGTTAGVMPATTTAAGLALTNAADAVAQRTVLGLVIGTNVQAYNADLAAIAGLTGAADRLPYFTGPGAAALATFTSYGRTLAALVDAAAGRTALGLATMALQAANNVAITGGAINGTAIGATTPSTGAFTTLSASGTTTVGPNNTGTGLALLQLLGGSGTNGGASVYFGTNGTAYSSIGQSSGILGGTTTDFIIYANNSGQSIKFYAGGSGLVGSISNTGLAVTGSITSTSAFISNGPVTTNGASRVTLDYDSGAAKSRVLGWGATTGTAGTLTLGVLSSNASVLATDVATITSTGLAVTGALSSTGILSGPGFRASKTTATSGLVKIQDEGANVYNVIGSRNNADSAALPLNFQATNFAFNGAVAVTGALSATGVISSGTYQDDPNTGTTDSVSINNAGWSFWSRGGVPSLFVRRRTSDGAIAQFYRDTTQVGSISVTTTATAYNTSSDARLKTNVRALTGSGAIIDALKPSAFDWKTGQKDSFGFIAQETFEVFPAAVTKGDDNPDVIEQQWAMDAGKFMPLAIAELKSLRARVAHLEAA